jgi:hypothetical protein
MKRKTFLLCVLAGTFACAYTPRSVNNESAVSPVIMPVQNKPYASLPIKLIRGLPHVEIMINGKGPYLVGFDSGFGGEFEIDSDLAREMGIPVTGKTSVGDPSGNNNVTMDVGKVNSIKLGDADFTNVSSILRPGRRNRPGSENVVGILGMTLFTAYTITVDYPKLMFLVEKRELPPADNKTIFDYQEFGGGVPGIKIKIGEHQVNGILDTRSMSSEFKVPEILLPKLHFASEPKVIGKGRTVSNEVIINEVKLKETIQFGENIFPEPTVTYPSFSEDALIGAKLLSKYALTFDQKNHRLQMIKGPEAKVDVSLTDFTGNYEGGRVISLSDGALYIKRLEGSLLKLIYKSKDEYGLNEAPAAVFQFQRDGNNKVIGFKLKNMQGEWETIKKVN